MSSHRSVGVGQSGAGVGILHLHAGTGTLVHPVQIGAGVGDGRFDLIEIPANSICQSLRRLGSGASGGKISNQCVHTNNLLTHLLVSL